MSMIIIAQIFSVFLGTLVITKSYADFKKKKESLTMFLFWATTWIIIVVIAFFPEIINAIAYKFGGQILGVGRVMGMAIIFIFFIEYRIYIKAQRVEQNFAELVRKIALVKRNK